MTRILMPLLAITIFSSCISTKKYASYVAPKFESVPINRTNNNIKFDLTALHKSDTSIVANSLTSQFIPAILFWQWNKTIQCDVDQTIIGESFETDFLSIADSLKVQDVLKDRQLEIKLEEIPNSFIYTNKGQTIIFIVAYAFSAIEAIAPKLDDVVVSYKLRENDAIIKQGKITVFNTQKPVRNVWKSTKKFTWMYVSQFKENNKRMTEDVINKLIGEI